MFILKCVTYILYVYILKKKQPNVSLFLQLLSDTERTPMDLLKDRHIYRPRHLVYEKDVFDLTEKVDGYVCSRFPKKFLSDNYCVLRIIHLRCKPERTLKEQRTLTIC